MYDKYVVVIDDYNINNLMLKCFKQNGLINHTFNGVSFVPTCKTKKEKWSTNSLMFWSEIKFVKNV